MNKTVRTILIICMALLLLFILGNAVVPGDLSRMESSWVQRHLTPLLTFLQSGRIEAALERLAGALPRWLAPAVYKMKAFWEGRVMALSSYLLVRKLAHFFEYLLLGFFLGLLLARKDGRSRIVLPALLCAATALTDELLQRIPGGRTSQLSDVYVDLSGAALGLLLALAVLAVIRLFRRSKSPEIGEAS